jgi:hypothetical protein
MGGGYSEGYSDGYATMPQGQYQIQGQPMSPPMMPAQQYQPAPGYGVQHDPQPTPIMQYPTTYYGRGGQAGQQPRGQVMQTSGQLPAGRPHYPQTSGIRR